MVILEQVTWPRRNVDLVKISLGVAALARVPGRTRALCSAMRSKRRGPPPTVSIRVASRIDLREQPDQSELQLMPD